MPGDDFWDLGKPKKKQYKAPEYSDGKKSVTLISDGEEDFGGPNTFEAEKIPARDESAGPVRGYGKTGGSRGRVVNTVGGPRNIPDSGRYTGSYLRKTPAVRSRSGFSDLSSDSPPLYNTVRTYVPSAEIAGGANTAGGGGAESEVILSVTVRHRASSAAEANRFIENARLSRNRERAYTAEELERPYTRFDSFVPRFRSMTLAQLEDYYRFRYSVERGAFFEAQLSYVKLLAFEIINLSGRREYSDVFDIDPREGLSLLSALWLNYRSSHPMLDSFMCETVADYCMIHALALPNELYPIIPEVVPKAQFKEFYFSALLMQRKFVTAARTFIETSSDYDYKKSRHYEENRALYDKHIPKAALAAIRFFTLGEGELNSGEKIYKTVRDSYTGAVISDKAKMRLEIEHRSFTKAAEIRGKLTAIVKYAENKLRGVLGIRTKLGSPGLDERFSERIDEYFASVPEFAATEREKKSAVKVPEPDYMKQYEAEHEALDLSRAAEIERESWANTDRLTSDSPTSDTAEKTSSPDLPESRDSLDSADSDEFPAALPDFIDGELSFDSEYLTELPLPVHGEIPLSRKDGTDRQAAETETPSSKPHPLCPFVLAAAEGRFSSACREAGVFDGDIAEKINTCFIESPLGDILLEADSDGEYKIIEEYRKDAVQWLSNNK